MKIGIALPVVALGGLAYLALRQPWEVVDGASRIDWSKNYGDDPAVRFAAMASAARASGVLQAPAAMVMFRKRGDDARRALAAVELVGSSAPNVLDGRVSYARSESEPAREGFNVSVGLGEKLPLILPRGAEWLPRDGAAVRFHVSAMLWLL